MLILIRVLGKWIVLNWIALRRERNIFPREKYVVHCFRAGGRQKGIFCFSTDDFLQAFRVDMSLGICFRLTGIGGRRTFFLFFGMKFRAGLRREIKISSTDFTVKSSQGIIGSMHHRKGEKELMKLYFHGVDLGDDEPLALERRVEKI